MHDPTDAVGRLLFEHHLVSLVHSGEYSTLEVAEPFGVGGSTVHRAIERQRGAAMAVIAVTPTSH